ncbi:hypothetical protein TrVFT333_008191 [Trichoderma virens FT-333]|nr:hypothetical protein TrVFT333_008191 [Trichoderma virens FT-333]
MVFSALKSAFAVGALAGVTAAGPLSTANVSQPIFHRPTISIPAAYQGLGLPMPSVVTITKQLTIVVSNVAVDCIHGPIPTPPPKPTCDMNNLLRPVTSTRQYCGGHVDLPPRGREFEHENEEEDNEEEDDEEDIDEDDDDEDEDDEDDDSHLEPRLSEDCTAQVMEGPSITIWPTLTMHTTTTTVSRYVNCGPCTNVSPIPYYSPGIEPVVKFSTTVTAIQPFTTTVLECEPRATRADEFLERDFGVPGMFPPAIPTLITKIDPWPPAITSYTDYPAGATVATCARIYHLFPSRLGRTRKIYTATHTSTAHKDCGDCALIWATGEYPVPVGPLPTTVTKKGSRL